MEKYHKIQTVYLRDPDNKFKTLLEGQWSKAEFEFLKNNIWQWREKIDGTNIRVMWDFDKNVFDEDMSLSMKIEFAGKTDKSDVPPVLLVRLPEIFYPQIFREAFGKKRVCLYGEGFGNRIQKKAGKFYLPDRNDFILFDVWIDGHWLNRENVENIAKKFGCQVVPIIGEGTLMDAIELVRIGFESTISEKSQLAEGIVATPKVELFGRNGKRVITKIKHKDFRK